MATQKFFMIDHIIVSFECGTWVLTQCECQLQANLQWLSEPYGFAPNPAPKSSHFPKRVLG